MSFTTHDLLRQVEDQQRELNDLRRRASPTAPKLADLRERQQVTPEQLAALTRAQTDGSLKIGPGKLRQVLQTDHTGRAASHFFGDEFAAWAPFCNPFRRGRIVVPER